MAEDKLDLSELHHDAKKASELSSYYSHFDTKVDDFDLYVYFNFRHKIKEGDGKYRYEYRIAKIEDTTDLKESIKDNVIKKLLMK